MKKFDFVILGFFITISIIGIIWIYLSTDTGTTCTVYVKGEFYGKYSLYEEQCIDVVIENQIVNTISIGDGQVWMLMADCPDHICINQGKISQSGKTICCAPNNVIVVVDDKGKAGEYDAITQ